MRARFVIHSTGVLNRPKLPGLEGIERLPGPQLPHQPLGLRLHRRRPERRPHRAAGQAGRHHRDRRVGHPGRAPPRRGGPASLRVPAHAVVGRRAGQQPDRPGVGQVPPTPAGSRSASRNFNVLVGGGHQEVDLVNDGWTDIITRLATFLPNDDGGDISPEQAARAAELADFEKMESIRARVDAIVDNKRTAEALKPYYRQFCKRPCFHDEYLPTYNRPNVTLVDTDGKGVARITETGVQVGDEHYEVDCLIFASGFEVGTSLSRRSGFETVGRDGITHQREVGRRSEDVPRVPEPGLPELLLHGPHADRLHAQLHADDPRAGAAHRLPRRPRRRGATPPWWRRRSRPRTSGRPRWSGWRCSPATSSRRARPATTTTRATSATPPACGPVVYGAGSEAFFQIIRTWRDAGDLDGLEVS